MFYAKIMSMKQVRVGIDIGNVIIGGDGVEDTSFFTQDFLKTPMVPDAFASIAEISESFDVWLLSKCGNKTQEKTLLWLHDKNFFAQTGVAPQQVLFCQQRPQKALIAQELGFKVFIDDREDIIDSMRGIVQQPILFRTWEKVHIHPLAWFTS